MKLVSCHRQLFAYGSDNKLDLRCCFETEACANGRATRATFYVYNGIAKCLLSFDTDFALGLISVNENAVANILPDDTGAIFEDFASVFKDVGKLKAVKLRLHIDRGVTPVAQPVRLPYGVREKVRRKINELVESDVIEPVHGVGTNWISPLVHIMEDSGDIRQTIDMRLANKAIVRERHPIPTTREVLLDMQGSKLFPTLDLKQGFPQIELEEGSRDITTFTTPFGLFRYKRLSMGLNSAPKQFQYLIQKALAGLEGVQNMADDIILYAKDREQHDIRLMALLRRLQELG